MSEILENRSPFPAKLRRPHRLNANVDSSEELSRILAEIQRSGALNQRNLAVLWVIFSRIIMENDEGKIERTVNLTRTKLKIDLWQQLVGSTRFIRNLAAAKNFQQPTPESVRVAAARILADNERLLADESASKGRTVAEEDLCKVDLGKIPGVSLYSTIGQNNERPVIKQVSRQAVEWIRNRTYTIAISLGRDQYNKFKSEIERQFGDDVCMRVYSDGELKRFERAIYKFESGVHSAENGGDSAELQRLKGLLYRLKHHLVPYRSSDGTPTHKSLVWMRQQLISMLENGLNPESFLLRLRDMFGPKPLAAVFFPQEFRDSFRKLIKNMLENSTEAFGSTELCKEMCPPVEGSAGPAPFGRYAATVEEVGSYKRKELPTEGYGKWTTMGPPAEGSSGGASAGRYLPTLDMSAGNRDLIGSRTHPYEGSGRPREFRTFSEESARNWTQFGSGSRLGPLEGPRGGTVYGTSQESARGGNQFGRVPSEFFEGCPRGPFPEGSETFGVGHSGSTEALPSEGSAQSGTYDKATFMLEMANRLVRAAMLERERNVRPEPTLEKRSLPRELAPEVCNPRPELMPKIRSLRPELSPAQSLKQARWEEEFFEEGSYEAFAKRSRFYSK